MAVKVGTFQKSVAAAPAVQSITGVGFPPQALILWTAQRVSTGTWLNNAPMSIGMSDGTREYSASSNIEHNVGTTNTVRYYDHALLNIISVAGVLSAQATLTSLDADGFTITWNPNTANGDYINYVAIGGDDLTNVYLKEWTLTNAAGNQSVAGVGFQPDLVIHIGNYRGGYGAANDAYIGFGAMGSGGNRFAAGAAEADAAVAGRGNTNNSSTDCLMLPTGSAVPLIRYQLDYVSMDADGFTISKGTVPAASSYVASLCLKGGHYAVGTFNEANVPGNQSVAGLPWQPEGVIIFSGCVNKSGVATAADAKLQLGAMDGTSQADASFHSKYNADPTVAKATERTDAVIVGGSTAASDQDVASMVSLDPTGFTINWSVTTNISNDYGYIAFDTGPYTPPVPPGPTPFTPVNSCDASIWLEDGSGTLRDVSGSSNKLRVSLSRATGFLRVFQFRWPLRLGGGKDAAFELDAAYTMAQDEAKDILLNWYNEDSPGPRALHLYLPDKNIGSDHFYGDVVIRKLAFQPAAGEGAPMLINAEMLPTGEWSYTTAAT